MQINLQDVLDKIEQRPPVLLEARRILKVAYTKPKTLQELEELIKVATPETTNRAYTQIRVTNVEIEMGKARFMIVGSQADDYI